MGRSADYSKQKSAIAATLDIVGEPWTLLILRDAFRGLSRFEQWQDSLGLARNVLAARLKSLVHHGVLEARVYCERPRRQEYILTEKGDDLRPILLYMMTWGEKHVYAGQEPEAELIHNCGHAFVPAIICDHCEARLKRGDVTVIRNDHAPTIGDRYAERGERQEDIESEDLEQV